jgi:hypothetical protein
MNVSGHLHALAALPLRKKSQVPNEEEACLDLELVWKLWKRERSLDSARNWSTISQSSSLKTSYYSEYLPFHFHWRDVNIVFKAAKEQCMLVLAGNNSMDYKSRPLMDPTQSMCTLKVYHNNPAWHMDNEWKALNDFSSYKWAFFKGVQEELKAYCEKMITFKVVLF